MSRRRTGQRLAQRVSSHEGADGLSLFMFTVVVAVLIMIAGLYARDYASRADCNFPDDRQPTSFYGCK